MSAETAAADSDDVDFEDAEAAGDTSIRCLGRASLLLRMALASLALLSLVAIGDITPGNRGYPLPLVTDDRLRKNLEAIA